MNVLVTGAAGYIGAHACELLRRSGYEVVGIDNFSRSMRDGVPKQTVFYEADIENVDRMAEIIGDHGIDVVMHFAGLISVAESVANPLRYHAANVGGALSLLAAMERTDVTRLVFSSTAAVYGIPNRSPIDEEHPTEPINPYGRSKLAVEGVLRDWSALGRSCMSLRYFNVAGAEEGCGPGERHLPETHLIPLLLSQAWTQHGAVDVFGDDYPTPDGTCIRDYVHVGDLIRAHIAAIDHLPAGRMDVFNIGIGHGYSVREVLASCERIAGMTIDVRRAARRPGDPPALVADSTKAQRELRWRPEFDSIDAIVASAWAAHRRRGSVELATESSSSDSESDRHPTRSG